MIYGGKAEKLISLSKKGFNVPEFLTIQTDILTETALLKSFTTEFLNFNLFAVRSSCEVEDGTKNSFAGNFYSAVNVDTKKLFEEYKNVIASYKDKSGAVIIQKFIPSDVSGVLFTNDGNNNFVINSNFGLCKNVVEGKPCDEYIINGDLQVINKNIAKSKECLFSQNNELKTEIIENKESLNIEQITLLINEAKKIKKHFENEQDIEWCFYKNELYILQSRPITRNISQNTEKIFYDSANIAESYSGIVLPLTVSFAEKIYKIVYENLIIGSGASVKKVRKFKFIFDKMVDSFYGRLYYNMNNWYLMMSFIPGYKRNKENLETMITSNIHENIEKEIAPSLFLKIYYPILLIFKISTFSSKIKKFKTEVRNYIQIFRNRNLQDLNVDDCINYYKDLEDKLLQKWHLTVENDFLVMTYFGVLKKKLSDEVLKNHINFDNKSIQQIDAVYQIFKLIKNSKNLQKSLNELDVNLFNQNLKNEPQIALKIEEYFTEYGGRFANELKLESTDIEEDRQKFLKLLKLYENYIPSVHKEAETTELKGFAINYSLKKFKKYAAQREELRLLRSNCFSVVRKIFNRIGEIFENQKLIEKSDDIYYLRISEIFDYKKVENIKQLIANRKNDYVNFTKLNPPVHYGISENEEFPQYIEIDKNKILEGRACTPGKITGKVKVFKHYYFPETIDFDIIVTRHTDPGWTTLIGLCKGLVIEQGGILSHAAIVSRELGIPTVIGVENATDILTDYQTITINGTTGKITI